MGRRMDELESRSADAADAQAPMPRAPDPEQRPAPVAAFGAGWAAWLAASSSRAILAGAAMVAIVVVGFFAVRGLRGAGGDSREAIELLAAELEQPLLAGVTADTIYTIVRATLPPAAFAADLSARVTVLRDGNP